MGIRFECMQCLLLLPDEGGYFCPLCLSGQILSPSFFPKFSVSSSIFLPFSICLLLSYSFLYFNIVSFLLNVDLAFSIPLSMKSAHRTKFNTLIQYNTTFKNLSLIQSSFSVNRKISQYQKCVTCLYIPCHITSQIALSALTR